MAVEVSLTLSPCVCYCLWRSSQREGVAAGLCTAYVLSLLREVFYGMQRNSSPASTVASSPEATGAHLKMIVRRN